MTGAPAPDPEVVDLLVVGAGPTGLYAAYYAGFRGLSVTVLDALPEVGGQPGDSSGVQLQPDQVGQGGLVEWIGLGGPAQG